MTLRTRGTGYDIRSRCRAKQRLKTQGELHESFFTKRKKDVIEFALTKGLPAYAVNRQTPYDVCFIILSAGH
jgi:hypothetical protein